jgi:catechol 2,3-dioxygenase-like lactoylglutathione lyase family enzyme
LRDHRPMMINRIVPNLNVIDAARGHQFYLDFLGLEKAFDLGWITNFRSPANPAAQVSLVSGDATAREDSVLSVGVDDVDAAYALAQRSGYEIVHPLTNEVWGVRRFFVRDPHGNVINIVSDRS